MALLTDDCDLRDVSMRMETGGNGDYYLSLIQFHERGMICFKRMDIRFAMSGGNTHYHERVRKAIVELYRAMEEAGLNKHPKEEVGTQKPLEIRSEEEGLTVWAIVNFEAQDADGTIVKAYIHEDQARAELEQMQDGTHEEHSVYAGDLISFNIARPKTQPLKYLQDMTKEDFKLIFKHNDFSFHIPEFNSLHGWAKGISMFGDFGSWDKAKELGYDVNFTLPIKQHITTSKADKNDTRK